MTLGLLPYLFELYVVRLLWYKAYVAFTETNTIVRILHERVPATAQRWTKYFAGLVVRRRTNRTARHLLRLQFQ